VTDSPTPFEEKPTCVRHLVLAAACTLAVLTYLQRQAFVTGMSYLKSDLRLDDRQVGFLLAAWLIAYGAFQLPGGLLGDRLGARHLLTLLVAGWSLTLAAVATIALVPRQGWLPFALLFALRSLFGLFQAGGFPGLARVIADWVPIRRRGYAQGLMWTFSRLGGFAAPLLFGLWLFPALGGWALPLVILAVPGLLWCAAFWPWFRNRPAEMPQVNEAERRLIAPGRPAAPPPRAAVPWLLFLRSRNVWALCLMYGFVGFSGNFITNWLPSYLKGRRNLSDPVMAWLSALPLAFGIVSCVLAGTLSDWLIRRTGSRNAGRRLVGGLSLALAAPLILAPVWIGKEDVVLLALAFCLAFFCNDAIMGPAWASCADIGDRHAGALSGAMNMTGQFFAAFAMGFAGVLFKQDLDHLVFIAFACSYALAALCWLLVDVTKPLEPAALPTPEPAAHARNDG
jgi:MFS transporter, ACS family, glucarate transporter